MELISFFFYMISIILMFVYCSKLNDIHYSKFEEKQRMARPTSIWLPLLTYDSPSARLHHLSDFHSTDSHTAHQTRLYMIYRMPNSPIYCSPNSRLDFRRACDWLFDNWNILKNCEKYFFKYLRGGESHSI